MIDEERKDIDMEQEAIAPQGQPIATAPAAVDAEEQTAPADSEATDQAVAPEEKQTEQADSAALDQEVADNLLVVRHLKQYFDIPTGMFRSRPLKAVDDVSFCIKKGETLGLVGESGCGKTTTGRSILHLYKPTSGEIYYRGKRIQTRADVREMRKHATMVFQDPYSSLDPRMTVSDIIAEPLFVHKIFNHIADPKARKEAIKARVRELMDLVGLNSEHANRYPHEFSGGQRQRIGIARALAVDPDFIVCDEPVSALDVSIQAQVINMFEDLQQKLGLTYLFIAHDLMVVRHISNRIAVMYLGHVVELSDSDTVCEDPLHPYSISLLSAVPIPDPKIAQSNQRVVLEGDVPSPLNMPTGCPFRTRCAYATEECANATPALREVIAGHYVACDRLEAIHPERFGAAKEESTEDAPIEVANQDGNLKNN